MEKDARGALGTAIANVYAQNGSEADVPYFATNLNNSTGQDKIGAAILYLGILGQIDNTALVNKGVDEVYDAIMHFNNSWVNNYIINLMQPLAKKKQEKAAASSGELRNELSKQATHILQTAQKIKEQTKED